MPTDGDWVSTDTGSEEARHGSQTALEPIPDWVTLASALVSAPSQERHIRQGQQGRQEQQSAESLEAAGHPIKAPDPPESVNK